MIIIMDLSGSQFAFVKTCFLRKFNDNYVAQV